MSRTRPLVVALASGGTGGHMFPAESLAHALVRRGHKVVLMTDRRGQGFGNGLKQVETLRIRSASDSAGLVAKAKAAFELAIGYGQARGALRALGPDMVVGFGGYPSAPTVFAAHRLGLTIALHEQNAHLGRVNRWLAPRAALIATSFAAVSGVAETDRQKIVVTGNPVRDAVAAIRDRPYRAPEEGAVLRLLVTGGSQGARVFSDIVPDALALLPEELRRRIEPVQQCRPEDLERVTARYRALGVKVELSSFFRDMADRLAAAHLVIGRAGASTVAELTVAGRPSILVPYPFATDDHQTANARALETTGAAWLMPQDDFEAVTLAQKLEHLLADPAMLERAAAAARAAGRPDATERLADAVVGLVRRNGGAGHAEEEIAA